MSLAFLSKKSWHTANLRNVEKVWIAEQKHAAEEKKVAELRKNIEQERQLQELRQLQADQGNKSAAIERVDWMYEGPSAAREKTAEEFLLGKEYKGEDEKTAVEDVDLSATTKYGSLAMTKSALPVNDAFQRLHEDPMMLIRKRQQAAREEVLKNPVKMKRIKDEVDRLKHIKKAKKASKKEKKQARKDEKRRLRKKRKLCDESDGSGEELDRKTENCQEEEHLKVYRGHDCAGERGLEQKLASRCRSPIRTHHDDDRRRSRSRRGEREPERNERSYSHRRSDRTNSRRYTSERGREERSPRGQRSSKHRQSRSPQRDHDAFGRELPPPSQQRDRSAGRHRNTRPGQDSRRNTGHRYENWSEKSCSRSPVARYYRRRSRSSIDRRERHRSRSLGDCPDRRRSRRSGERHEEERPGLERTRRDRSSRQDVSKAQANKSVEVRGHDESRTEPESRRKPVDTEGKYGLISTTDAVELKDVDKTSLGPSAKHLEKAREVKRLEEDERQRKLGKSSCKEASKLTNEEKKQMAQQMVEDAKKRDEYMKRRATLKKDELGKLEQDATSSNPDFLRKLRSEAYLDSESSMSDRLHRNAHYIQRKADASNFLTK
uniref:CBF1-interacting co-repressor CIR N-terminal domain-containing protein n=1 Tax=Peronospora matthiolae TaxID=2874970 RepID=A0AAV1V683_9STRA